MADDELGVENFKSRKLLAYVTGFELGGVRDGDTYLLSLELFYYLFEAYLLQLEYDVGYIFLDSLD